MSQTSIRRAASSGGFAVRQFRPFEKNTLLGFLELELPSGLIIHDITLHEKGDSRWVSMPAKQYEKNGEKTWIPLVEFTSKETRERFQAAALAALDEYMAEDPTK
jgi:DNA-binding cell septation regulator SpoVG